MGFWGFGVLGFCILDDFFRFSKKIEFSAILGPPYCGIGATIRIGREMLCLPYAGFFSSNLVEHEKAQCICEAQQLLGFGN